MNRMTAWALIGAALGIGVIVGQTLAQRITPATELGISCLMLREAEKSGHLDAQKRADLIAQLSKSPTLRGMDQQIAAMLKGGCGNLFGGGK